MSQMKMNNIVEVCNRSVTLLNCVYDRYFSVNVIWEGFLLYINVRQFIYSTHFLQDPIIYLCIFMLLFFFSFSYWLALPCIKLFVNSLQLLFN